MQRVIIVGSPGSGKTTLARTLGVLTGLEVYHMDHIHWQAGWVPRAEEEKRPLIAAIHARERWIFEGSHSATFTVRAARADTLIWLDLPFGLRLCRVLWRTARLYGRTRPDLPPGCPERLSRDFLAYMWRTRNSGRLKPLSVFLSPPPHLALHRLASPRDVTRFIAAMANAAGSCPREQRIGSR